MIVPQCQIWWVQRVFELFQMKIFQHDLNQLCTMQTSFVVNQLCTIQTSFVVNQGDFLTEQSSSLRPYCYSSNACIEVRSRFTFHFFLQASGPNSVYTKPQQYQEAIYVTCLANHLFLNFLATSSSVFFQTMLTDFLSDS